MSDAHALFVQCFQGMIAPSELAFERLSRAAELWRATGQHFSAGVAMSRAVYAAWGKPNAMAEAQRGALKDFNRALINGAVGSPEWLASIQKLRTELGHMTWLFDADRAAVRTEIRQLGVNLASYILAHYANSPYADNYLVRGIGLRTNLDGEWTIEFPPYEVPLGSESVGANLILYIPSAFHLFIDHADWYSAHQIIRERDSAFTSPGLQGWKAVVSAYVEPRNAVEHFDEAADAFARDTPPSQDQVLAGSAPWSWSGINAQLWANYFRARARLHEAIRNPTAVKELLTRAVSCLEGSRSGWHSSEVARFRVLIETLYKVVSDPSSLSTEGAQRDYLGAVRLSGDSEEDRFALTFISEVTRAFRGLEADPSSELTKNGLAAAVDALSRIPLIGPDIAEAIRPAIGKSAFQTMLGPIRTWMHDALKSVEDEKKLRAILLRLFRAGLPLYAQILHGPIEYGKDIATLVGNGDAVVLRFYQVKCGDIDKRKWRESKDELEEMFAVSLASLHLPLAPTSIQGVLVTNGHANPYVAPVMEAWIREQREKLGHDIEFMHLDTLVDWITDSRLINELRLALTEEGIVMRTNPNP